MSNTPQDVNAHELVKEFHLTYGHPVRTSPTLATQEERDLRIALIKEEVKELEDALEAGDLTEVFDALLDIEWVTNTCYHAFGLPRDAGLLEVARSNRSKLDEKGNPIYHANGKIAKGPNYSLPNLEEIIRGYTTPTTTTTSDNSTGSR